MQRLVTVNTVKTTQLNFKLVLLKAVWGNDAQQAYLHGTETPFLHTTLRRASCFYWTFSAAVSSGNGHKMKRVRSILVPCGSGSVWAAAERRLVPLRVVSGAVRAGGGGGGVWQSPLTSPQRGDSENKQFPQTARSTPQFAHSRSLNWYRFFCQEQNFLPSFFFFFFFFLSSPLRHFCLLPKVSRPLSLDLPPLLSNNNDAPLRLTVGWTSR